MRCEVAVASCRATAHSWYLGLKPALTSNAKCRTYRSTDRPSNMISFVTELATSLPYLSHHRQNIECNRRYSAAKAGLSSLTRASHTGCTEEKQLSKFKPDPRNSSGCITLAGRMMYALASVVIAGSSGKPFSAKASQQHVVVYGDGWQVVTTKPKD